MFNKSLNIKKVHDGKILLKTDLRDILNIIEFLAVIICIPLAYKLTEFLFNNFTFPFHQIEFKLFLLRYLNYFNYAWQFNLFQFILFSVLIIISWFVHFQLSMMAKLPRNQRYLSIIIHYIRDSFIIFLLLISSKFILNLTSIPVIFIFTFSVLSMTVTLVIRLVSIYKLGIYRAKGYNLRHIMLFADDNYVKIIDKLIEQKNWGFKINSIITGSEKLRSKYGNTIPVLSNAQDIKNILDNNIIDEVLYCKKENDSHEIRRLVKICNEIGVIFRIQSCTSTVDPMQISLRTINQNGKLTLVDVPAFKLPLKLKTIIDVYISTISVLLLSPLLVFIAILIKLESKGPVFFKQERIGLRGRKFYLYKFRTMVNNAEELLDNLKVSNEMDGPTFKIKNDPRVTKIGKFMRKTGIDEFPQLYNVLKGEMSLIGPRPPLESEVKQYERWQLRRLSVKPGITCTWQVTPQRNDVKFEKWVNMDLNYIDNWSIGLDLRLFLKTITVIFLAEGR